MAGSANLPLTAEQAAEAGKDLDFAKVWSALMETREQIAELSKNIGGVNNTLGKLTEEMVAAKVLELFQNLGFDVAKAGRNIKFYKGHKALAEIDVFLENGDVAVAVERKTSLSVRDVNGHLECMTRLRGYMDEHGDKRKLVGVVAGGVVPDDVREYAQQHGFYVLVQSGESMCVAEAAPGFVAQQW